MLNENSDSSGGYIYCMTNPSFKDGYCKCGFSNDPERRRKELSNRTAVPRPYELIYSMRVSNMRDAEALLHRELPKAGFIRDTRDREFFLGDPEDMKRIFDGVALICSCQNMSQSDKESVDIKEHLTEFVGDLYEKQSKDISELSSKQIRNLVLMHKLQTLDGLWVDYKEWYSLDVDIQDTNMLSERIFKTNISNVLTNNFNVNLRIDGISHKTVYSYIKRSERRYMDYIKQTESLSDINVWTKAIHKTVRTKKYTITGDSNDKIKTVLFRRDFEALNPRFSKTSQYSEEVYLEEAMDRYIAIKTFSYDHIKIGYDQPPDYDKFCIYGIKRDPHPFPKIKPVKITRNLINDNIFVKLDIPKSRPKKIASCIVNQNGLYLKSARIVNEEEFDIDRIQAICDHISHNYSHCEYDMKRSYGFKHELERQKFIKEGGGYVRNGEGILACLCLGIRIEGVFGGWIVTSDKGMFEPEMSLNPTLFLIENSIIHVR